MNNLKDKQTFLVPNQQKLNALNNSLICAMCGHVIGSSAARGDYNPKLCNHCNYKVLNK